MVERSGSEIHLSWDRDAPTRIAVAAFAASVIGRDTDYISHGEIQTGLSSDAEHWSVDLGSLYAEDMAALDEERDLLVARLPDGTIVGIVILAWEETPRRRFAVLEDMVVDPGHRSLGIGGWLVDAVVRRVQARGRTWLFLESGVRNERAHAFFERHGFDMVSHVFARKLDPLSP